MEIVIILGIETYCHTISFSLSQTILLRHAPAVVERIILTVCLGDDHYWVRIRCVGISRTLVCNLRRMEAPIPVLGRLHDTSLA